MYNINTWNDGDDLYRGGVVKQVSGKSDPAFRCRHAKFKNTGGIQEDIFIILSIWVLFICQVKSTVNLYA